jgi:hypothetical protein
MALMTPAYGWLMVPLLVGCTAGALQWDKPGAAQAAIDEDVQNCRTTARVSPEASLAGPNATTSGDPLVDGGQERGAREAQDVRSCMEGKGYRLKR